MTAYRHGQEGPFTSGDVPRAALRRVRIRCRHGADEAETEVSACLAGVMGKARVWHTLRGRELVWRKPRWHVSAKVTRRGVTVRARDIKASQLLQLVDALATLPAACDLRIDGKADP